jgi:hypothetical protein
VPLGGQPGCQGSHLRRALRRDDHRPARFGVRGPVHLRQCIGRAVDLRRTVKAQPEGDRGRTRDFVGLEPFRRLHQRGRLDDRCAHFYQPAGQFGFVRVHQYLVGNKHSRSLAFSGDSRHRQVFHVRLPVSPARQYAFLIHYHRGIGIGRDVRIVSHASLSFRRACAAAD